MNLPFETMQLKFGIHKGKSIKDVPDDYLKFLLSRNILKGKLLFYCQNKFDLPKNKYQVIVKDSVGTDGTYIVEAWNSKHAVNECKKLYNIQITQNFNGTSFDTKNIN